MEELKEFDALLVKIHSMERVQWNTRLADELMARCQLGHAEQGGRRIQRPVTVVTYHNTAAKSERACWGDRCRMPKKPRFGGRVRSKTFGLCWCDICSLGKGKAGALYLRKTCNAGKDSNGKWTDGGHRAAAMRAPDPSVKKPRLDL